MSILKIFRSQKKTTANIAKERLQIIVAHERSRRGPDYLPKLQQEILDVIKKYVQINQDQVQVKFQNGGDCQVLELNVTLSEEASAAESA